MIVKVRTEENKKNMVEKKRFLKGRKEWIKEDQTFRERTMEWKLRVVRVVYGKI